MVELAIKARGFDSIGGHLWLRLSSKSCQSGQGSGWVPYLLKELQLLYQAEMVDKGLDFDPIQRVKYGLRPSLRTCFY